MVRSAISSLTTFARRNMLLGSFGLVLTACVDREEDRIKLSTPEPVPVSELSGKSIIVGDMIKTTQSVMESSGQLKNLPYNIEFKPFISGPPIIEAANAQRVDFAEVGTTPPIFGAASHAQFRLISAYASDGEGEQIVVHNGSDIKTVNDLRGKKIAVGRGTSSHGHMLSELALNNISPLDVNVVYLDPPEAEVAFLQNNVDAWAIWDPYTAQVEHDGCHKLISAQDTGIYSANVGIASVAALTDPIRNAIIADLVLRLADAWLWANQNRDVWSIKYAANTGFSLDAIKISNDRGSRIAIPVDDSVVNDLQVIAKACAKGSILSSEPMMKNFCDYRFGSEIVAFRQKNHLPKVP